ncbi:MAG: chemotaxis protein CheW [Acidobacteriota bacterium]
MSEEHREDPPLGRESAEPFILFELAGATYGVRSREVRQVDMIEQITPVPDSPPYLEGVVFSRGRMIPAVNLRVRFGFERTEFNLRSRLVVVQTGSRIVGLIVDTAREFASIVSGSIVPPSEDISGLSGQYLEGIVRLGDRLILILKMEEVLRLTNTDQADEHGPSADGDEVLG